jgi:hypothetical protein
VSNMAWGPSKTWRWGDYDRYQLSYYSRKRRTRNRWEFVIAGTGAAARTPWGAILRARRHYKTKRLPA